MPFYMEVTRKKRLKGPKMTHTRLQRGTKPAKFSSRLQETLAFGTPGLDQEETPPSPRCGDSSAPSPMPGRKIRRRWWQIDFFPDRFLYLRYYCCVGEPRAAQHPTDHVPPNLPFPSTPPFPSTLFLFRGGGGLVWPQTLLPTNGGCNATSSDAPPKNLGAGGSGCDPPAGTGAAHPRPT